MAIQVLFIQGGGSAGTHDEWDQKLVDSLRRELESGYDIRYPLMPDEADPSYAGWKGALVLELAKLDAGAIVVGHSIGATVLINVLAERPPEHRLGGIFLIAAPFIGDAGWPSDEIQPKSMLGAELPEHVPVYLYHGSADEIVPVAHLALYEMAIPQAVARRLEARDHQLDDDLSEVARDIRGL
jgi:predicted alpha/beta hydrolase family esterase